MMWTDIVIEGYCIADDKDIVPKYCKRKLQFTCLSESCPFFGYCDAEKEVYLHVNKFYKDNK